MREGRRSDELRPVEIVVDYLEQPMGSVLYSQGRTKVLCTASLNEGVPRWMRDQGRGWLTAEYSLLPASTGERTQREASAGRQKGRTVEIQRLIGRAIRSVADYEALVSSLHALRSAGCRIAVDDAGAGYASLRHILRLRPDYIKLDMTLTRDIDTDADRRALASSLHTFAREVSATVIAEGIETAADLDALRSLGAVS